MVVAGVLAGAAAPSFGSLVVDLRVAPGGGPNVKTAAITKVGDVVPLEVWAVVTGKDTQANEGVGVALGSFVSTLTNNGFAVGNFSLFRADGAPSADQTKTGTPFAQVGWQNGFAQNINGQPGNDLGPIGLNDQNNPAWDPTQYAGVRGNPAVTATAPQGAVIDPTSAGDTFAVRLGTLNWTVTSLPQTGTTTLSFVPAANGTTADPSAASWIEDGASKNPLSATFGTSPTPVAVTLAPEPASIGMLGLASLGLLARRRRAL